VGGGIFYLLVLRPAVTSGSLSSDSVRAATERFGGLVKLAMWTLVVTGAVLFFSRISEPTATARYAAVLALKVALSAWMFFIAIRRRRRLAEAIAVRPGRIRAVAAALGHETERIYMATFAVGSALSGLAGAVLAPLVGLVPGSGAAYIAKAFITVIAGGPQLLAGLMSSATFFGVVNQLFTFTISPVIGEVALLVAAVILLRMLPRGITGRFFRERSS